jgi:hypothetical protein
MRSARITFTFYHYYVLLFDFRIPRRRDWRCTLRYPECRGEVIYFYYVIVRVLQPQRSVCNNNILIVYNTRWSIAITSAAANAVHCIRDVRCTHDYYLPPTECNPLTPARVHTILPVCILLLVGVVIITFISIILHRLIESCIRIWVRVQASEGVKGHHRRAHDIYNTGIRFASEAVHACKKKKRQCRVQVTVAAKRASRMVYINVCLRLFIISFYSAVLYYNDIYIYILDSRTALFPCFFFF